MNKKYLLIPIMLVVLLLAACGGGDTATPETTDAPTNTPQEAIEPQPMIEPVSTEAVQDIIWQWNGLIETQPAAQSMVPNPENYTLTLRSDNTFSAQADCNMLGGSYQAEGSFITFSLGPSTMAECAEESFYNQYIAMLGSVATFGMLGDQMVLGLQDNAGQMQFANAGPAEVIPTPTARACDSGIDPETVSIDTQDLYENYLAECVLATAYDKSMPPTTIGLPDNIQVYFDPLETQERQPGDPILYIVPVAEYIALWQANGNQSVAESVLALKELLETKPEPIPTSGLPILPYEEVMGVPDIQVQGKYLTITKGEGVRFVSRFSQGPNPVTSDNPPLFYTFQGFSSDGVYLISFFNPLTTTTLPASEEITEEERQQMDEDNEAYLEAKTTQLNTLSTSDWIPDLNTLDAMITSLKYGPEPDAPQPSNPLTNIRWLWTTLTQTNPASQSVIADPEFYNVVFQSGGGLLYRADCNTGSGSYTINGNQLTITLGQASLVECGEASLSTQFTALLTSVATYSFESGGLILGLKDNAGTMGFVNGGTYVDTTPPGTGVPTATTTDAVNVRSGPGTEYFAYGVVSTGTTFEVVGVSGDGQWWHVVVPTSLSPSGRGWVNTNYCETENTENVPVVPAPPLDTPTASFTATLAPEATGTLAPEATASATSEPEATETPTPEATAATASSNQ